MKHHRNPILRGVTSRIRQLLERYRESEIIRHAPTKGSLREAYLKQFLADLVPHPFAVTEGFVTDCRGDEISPQIDLLIFDRTSIPGFALSRFVTVLPVESVRLAVEVKSVLETRHFGQIADQQAAIRRLRLAWTTHDRSYLTTVNCLGLSQIVFAYASECSRDTLLGWFNKEAALDAICVIGELLMVRDARTHTVEIIKADDQNREVLHLVSTIHATVLRSQRELQVAQTRETPEGTAAFYPDIGSYLTFDVPYPDSESKNVGPHD